MKDWATPKYLILKIKTEANGVMTSQITILRFES